MTLEFPPDAPRPMHGGHLAILSVPLEQLVLLLSGRARSGGTPQGPVPPNARVERMYLTQHPSFDLAPGAVVLDIVLEHPAFPRVPDGELIPRLGKIIAHAAVSVEDLAPPIPGLRLLQGRLARLEVQPGDTLVMMSDGPLPAAARGAIEAQLMQIFPGHKAICLEGGLTLGAVNVPQLREKWEAHHRGPEPAPETQGA